ncbi:hypothetical protein SH661x_003319 [Planctomicrobium sp. SH661]|uniref:hypothetical protein n=1 Tax=Planctomicrobium sp. SH661 TaxID=3448124 RepID=UPI003F5C0154
MRSLRLKFGLPLKLAAFLIPATVFAADSEVAVERNYSASSGKIPSEVSGLEYASSTTGTAELLNGLLRTTDTDAAGDGRFFSLPSGILSIDSETDLTLTFGIRVARSEGSRTATAIELLIPSESFSLGPFRTGGHGEGYQDVLAASRMIALGFLSDGKDHQRDEVLLIDPNRPVDEGILERISIPLDQLQDFKLQIQRGAPGPADDRLILSLEVGKELASLELARFQTSVRPANSSILFGHPATPGIADAQWRNVNLKVENSGRTQSTENVKKPAVAVGAEPQMFIDDFLIESRSNVTRVQGHPEKLASNPVLKREMPWEDARCELYGSAIWNPAKDRIELYYSATKRPYDAKLAVAYSSDEGMTWSRPELDVFPWEGKPSNIVWPGRYWSHGPCVLFDPHDPDANRRYKLFLTAAPVDPANENAKTGPKGIDVAFSPDGVQWTPAAGNPVIPGFNSDTGNCVIWDAKKNVYRAYVRIRCNVGRSVAITESPDFIHWSEPRTIYIPTHFDAARKWEFYGLSVTQIGEQYIGLVWVFPSVPESGNMQSHSAVTWPELVVSRDGENWERPFPGEAFLPLGDADQFDHRQIRPASSLTLLPDRVLLLYSGSPHAHVAGHTWDIGLATLRADGFASLQAGEEAGEIVTRALLPDGKQLQLNAHVQAGGEIRAELLNDKGEPIKGFTLADSNPLKGDHLNAPVAWKNQAELPATAGQPVKLRLMLKNAQVYSLHVAPTAAK